MKNRLLLFTLSILFPLAARADLKFEQTQVELHPGIADKETVGHFKYQNTGDKPIHFRSVHASCGCTTAQTQKDVVQPGEKGEITATFKIGDRTGTQIKTVTVDTDDPVHATTVLTLKAVLPEMLQIQPALIAWNVGETAAPKTITVKPSKDFPIKQLNVNSPSPEFTANVERDSNSGEFKIAVTPKATTHPAATALTIQPEGTQKMFYATVRVMPAPATPATSPVTN
jgi:hypothetical protein